MINQIVTFCPGALTVQVFFFQMQNKRRPQPCGGIASSLLISAASLMPVVLQAIVWGHYHCIPAGILPETLGPFLVYYF